MRLRRSQSKRKEKKPKRKAKGKFSAESQGSNDVRLVSTSEYGEVRMLRRTGKSAAGQELSYWEYDPDFEPKLPKGAIRGDVRKQVFCPMCWDPKYYYVDIDKTCVQCGKEFIFSAKEQKYWYETLKFHFASEAIRCVACRRQRRSDRAIQEQLSRATALLRERPKDSVALVGLAEATVRYHERLGSGDLNKAISACRKAQKLSPVLVEAVFWEAMCQERAGRASKAKSLYERFVDVAGGRKGRCYSLVKNARERMATLPETR